MTTEIQTVTLAIILGTLVAIVYALRILVLLERRIARVDHHVELMAMGILKDEKRILSEENRLEEMIKQLLPAPAAKKSVSKPAAKKSVSKPVAKKSVKSASSKKKSVKK